MKKIGIVIRSFEENGKLFVGCRKDVFDAFTSDFVQIIFIPIEFSYQQVLDLVRLCDGIVLTGGDHFVRQAFWLINYLYQNDVPTLGICLGMQAMALCFGNAHEIEVKDIHYHGKHDVYVIPGTFLYQIVGEEFLSINSRHKTAVVDTDLCISAKSNDGVIEAVEDKHKRFFLGVQWHPESVPNKKSDLIIKAFIKSLK